MYPEPDFKEIDQDRRKIFELNQNGEDELVLIAPASHIERFLTSIVSFFRKREQSGKNPDVEGYYITHRGTLKEQQMII